MDSRHPHAPRPGSRRARLLALALASSLAWAAGAASPTAPAASRATAPLAEAEVRAFMRGVADASRRRDVEALAATLAPDCTIELTTRTAGAERTTQFTRDEYVGMLRNGYASMKDLEEYDYDVEDLAVELDAGGTGATVHARVRERAVFQGSESLTRSEETSRVERRDGRLALVSVTATTQSAR